MTFAVIALYIAIFVTALGALGFTFCMFIGQRAEKLEFAMMPPRWLTFEEILALGFAEWECRALLGVFVEDKLVEVRPSAPFAGNPAFEDLGLDFGDDVAALFEYRLILRPPRRKMRTDRVQEEHSFDKNLVPA